MRIRFYRKEDCREIIQLFYNVSGDGTFLTT